MIFLFVCYTFILSCLLQILQIHNLVFLINNTNKTLQNLCNTLNIQIYAVCYKSIKIYKDPYH